MHAALPMPDDPERSIARALFIRDLEQPLRQFWTREAAAQPEGLNDDDLREVDARWRKLAREGVLAILHSASGVTQKVLEVVNRFPPEERDYAWSVERARLTDPAEQQRIEDAFTQQMLGPGFASDVGWIARFNKLRHAGEQLQNRWRAWNRTPERVKELTLPRAPELERAIVEQPDSLERRLLYAEWLCEQSGGESLGEYIQLSAAKPTSWRAELLVEHDCSVVGPLIGSSVSLDWRLGLISSAVCWSSELALLFAHAASFTVERIELMVDDAFSVPEAAPRLKFLELSTDRETWETELAQRTRDTLVELSRVAPLEKIEVRGPHPELVALLREAPWKVTVLDNLADYEFGDEDDDDE